MKTMEDLIHALKPQATIRSIRKGSTLLYQGEIPRQAFIVRSGVMRAYTITTSGEERIVALYGKGDIFPLTWIFGETTNTLFYYEALSDTQLVCAPKDAVLAALSQDQNIMMMILKYTVNQYTALLLRVTALEQSKAAEKIAFTLYYLVFRYGIEKKPGLYTIDIRMTQIMIASFVGLTRESTTINLRLLKKKKVIEYDSFTYTVNKENLEKFIGEDNFKDLQLR
jgi:CRP-like cAMP-binding protein